MVAGKNENGDTIYFQPGGQVGDSPHYFPSVEAATQALQQWVQRARNGNVGSGGMPDQRQGRPSNSEVRKDAAAKDEGSVAGILGRAQSYAKNNPVKTTVAVVGASAGAYYLYNMGYFDEVLTPIENTLGEVSF
jgi:hypothetical protein